MSWWKKSVFYHIYPRSFSDTTGNGVGDLKGISNKLDYLLWLGIDTIWLSPIFKSPMADFGYDISDHCEIDPLFGKMEDFDELLEKAHEKGLKIVLDMILHNTSYDHPWFQESKSSRDNPKADWYIWKDADENGNVPNNWLNFFSGKEGSSAWTWEETRQQYYLHVFSAKQCDLNLRNPEVQNELEKILRFWLNKGVDGFRLDSVSTLFKDPEFRDFPERSRIYEASSFSALSKYFVDNVLERPENILAVEKIRKVLDDYDGERIAIGESASEKGLISYLDYSSSNRLHFAFNFNFLNALGLDAEKNFEIVKQTEELFDSRAWPCYVMGHHDTSRLFSRISRENRKDDPSLARLFGAFLLTLRGTPFLYYGEEIGMSDTAIPFDKIVDPFGKAVWPAPGRDEARTPMQWDSTIYGGFSDADPWLPLNKELLSEVNVDSQKKNPQSVLHFFRSLLTLRKNRKSLNQGTFLFQKIENNVAVYSRNSGAETTTIILNFNNERTGIETGVQGTVLLGSHRKKGESFDDINELNPLEALIIES